MVAEKLSMDGTGSGVTPTWYQLPAWYQAIQAASRRHAWIRRVQPRCALRAPGFVGSTMRPSMPVLAMAKQLHVSRSVLLPAVVGINAKQEQPNSKLLHLVVGAGMLTVLSQNSYDYSESVGKKRKKDSGRPEGLPHLAKMARQFLGRPASSAGVERMFSKAGKLHGDTKKSQDDATLQFSLLAASNSE